MQNDPHYMMLTGKDSIFKILCPYFRLNLAQIHTSQFYTYVLIYDLLI